VLGDLGHDLLEAAAVVQPDPDAHDQTAAFASSSAASRCMVALI
jgi:hypothetical protein